MTNTKGGIIKKDILKGLVKITLVLGLVAFSGHTSGLKSYHAESTKTELTVKSSVSSKRTVSFKKIFDSLTCSIFRASGQKEEFTSWLRQYQGQIKVKLDINSKEYITIKKFEKSILLVYSNEKSEELTTNRLRG